MYWNDIDIEPGYFAANSFVTIIQKVLRDKHDLVIKEETLDRGIDQLTMRLVRKCPCPVWVLKRGSADFRCILGDVDVGAEKTINTINCTVLTVKPDSFVSPVTLS